MSKPTRLTFDSRDTGDGTPRPGDYIARLDKSTGLRVLCGYTDSNGRQTCTGELAQISEIGRDKIRELVMSPGWRPNDRGVWSRIRWLDTRERAGYGSSSRFRRGQVRNSYGGATGQKDERPHQIAAFIGQFPIVAICPVPGCRHRNVLDAITLRVMTEEEKVAAFSKLDNA